MLRVVFMGSADVSAVMLDALAYMKAAEVVGVVTQPDRPFGRHQHFMPCPCKAKADVNGLTIICPEHLNCPEVYATLKVWAPDLIVVVAYGQFLRREILELPPLGCINIHLSLLPKYRGASPVQHAILAGDTITGVTAMMMDAGMDSGDILMQAMESILPGDTASSLHDRLTLLGAVMLLRVVRQAELGELKRVEQDHALATYAPKLKKEDGLINWHLPAAELVLRVRALNPWPACFTWVPHRVKGGKCLRTKILRAEAVARVPRREPAYQPGEICDVRGAGPVVMCGTGGLRLVEVQPEGARPMSGKALINGCQLSPGDRMDVCEL